MNSDLEKTVVTLERVSLEQQAGPDRAGLAQQRERNRRTIELNGLRCVGRVVLKNVSGTAVRQTSEIQEILRKIQRGEIGGVVVADLDRLSRTTRFEDFQLFQTFQDANAVIWTTDGVLRPGSPDGALSILLKAGMGAMELEHIRRRMWSGREELRRKGLCASGPQTLPRGIGWDRAAKKYILVSPDIDAVKLAFELVDVHGIKNYCEISRRTGCGIKATSLKNILRNPIYSGTRVYGMKRGPEKYRSINGRQAERKKVRRAQEEIIRVKVFDDPPVDPARFARVQKILDETNRRWKDIRSHKTHVVFLAGGIAYCSNCGSPLYGSAHPKKSGKVDAYYRCRSNVPRWREKSGGCSFAHVRREKIDQPLLDLVCRELSRPALLQKMLTHALEAARSRLSDGKSPEEIEAILLKLDRRRERLTIAFENELISLGHFKNRLKVLDSEQAVAQRLLAVSSPRQLEIRDVARRIVRGALAFRRIQEPAAMKAALDHLISRVVFRGTKIVSVSFRPQFEIADGIKIDCSAAAVTPNGTMSKRKV